MDILTMGDGEPFDRRCCMIGGSVIDHNDLSQCKVFQLQQGH
jgi:hypothetical protein